MPGTESMPETTTRGRPRGAGMDEQLLRATQELLVEVGYDRLSMDAVAARCSAGRATIYRRWPNKAALVTDAVTALHRPQPLPDTGTLRGDLLALAQAFYSEDVHRNGVIAGLISTMSATTSCVRPWWPR